MAVIDTQRTSELYTLGQLATAFGVKPARVAYIVRRHGVPYLGRVGNVRLFDRAGAEAIRRGLEAMAERYGLQSTPAWRAEAWHAPPDG